MSYQSYQEACQEVALMSPDAIRAMEMESEENARWDFQAEMAAEAALEGQAMADQAEAFEEASCAAHVYTYWEYQDRCEALSKANAHVDAYYQESGDLPF